jgi:CelD/BcsL family acetyltransferase involved in cellulose biosynthesis
MQICVVPPRELGPGEIAAWHAMQRGTESLANPFLSPEFVLAVGRVRPEAKVAILTDGTSVAGFFPFERRRLGLGVPIASGLTDCQGLIHAPGVEWDPRQLLRACHISAWQFDHLADGQGPFQRYRSVRAPSPVIDLAEGFDAYYQKLRFRSPNVASVVARKSRKLEREIGEIHFELNAPDTSALRLLMRWKSAQYRRTGRPDRFSQPWIVDLLESLSATSDASFSGVLSVLSTGNTPVAAHFGIRCGHVLAYWFPAYDPARSKYSPGLISLLRLTQDSASHGVRVIDLGKGTMRYKEAMKSTDIFVGEGIVCGRSPLAAMHRSRVASVQRAMRTVRGNQRLFDAADWVLKRYARSRDGGSAVVPGGPGAG